MSKKFDEEFKAYAVKDIPDLWDRIEPALNEKVPVKQKETEAAKKEQSVPVKRKKRSFQHYLPIVIPGICAAAIILLLLPTFLLPPLFKKSYMWSAKSEDLTVPQMAENAGGMANATDDYAAETVDAVYDNGASYETAMEDKDVTANTQGASIAAAGEADKSAGTTQKIEAARVLVDILEVREENGMQICLIRLCENLPENFPVKGECGEELEVIAEESGNSLPGTGVTCSVLLKYQEEEEIPLLLTYIED